MIDVYGKDEAEDLSNDEKRELQRMAKAFVEELRARQSRGQL